MRILTVNPSEPREDRLSEAAAVLESGGLVGLPTETFYGIAADIAAPAALARINALKAKAEHSPLLVLLSETSQAEQVSGPFPERFLTLAAQFWPGPLTLVIPAAPSLAREVTGGGATVAVRVPGLALPRRLARILARPITGVSANSHGVAPCRTAAEVHRTFPEGLEMILDGGPTAGGAASTILDLSGERPLILREGLIPGSSLEPLLPDLMLGPARL